MIDLTVHIPNSASTTPVAPTPPPSQAEIDAFFKDFREGRKSTSTEEVRNYVLSMSQDDFIKHSGTPALPAVSESDVEPTLMFPGYQSKEDFIMSELLGDMMGAPRAGN